MSNNEKVPFTRVVIIGAGFSGVAMACQLQRKLGCNDYAIYDRSPSPGGTWWANQCMLYRVDKLSMKCQKELMNL